jgi:hypothetical protein
MELTQFSMYVREDGGYSLVVEIPCKLEKVQEDFEFLIDLINKRAPNEISEMSINNIINRISNWSVNNGGRFEGVFTTVEMKLT